MSEERIKTKVQMGILKPAHEIFEAIVDPDKMNEYFFTTSTGRMESGKTLTWSWEDYDASHEVKVQYVEKDLEEMKDFWKNEVLTESVLNPGDIVGGLVYLPFSSTAELFRVIIPVCDLPKSHLFRQVQINK